MQPRETSDLPTIQVTFTLSSETSEKKNLSKTLETNQFLRKPERKPEFKEIL